MTKPTPEDIAAFEQTTQERIASEALLVDVDGFEGPLSHGFMV